MPDDPFAAFGGHAVSSSPPPTSAPASSAGDPFAAFGGHSLSSPSPAPIPDNGNSSTPPTSSSNEDDPWYKKAWNWANTPLTESFGIPSEREGAGGFERAGEHILSGLTSPLSIALTVATLPFGGEGGLLAGAGESALRETGAFTAEEIANAIGASKVAATTARSLPDIEPVIQKALEAGGHDLGLLNRAKSALGPVNLEESLGEPEVQAALEKKGFSPEEIESLGKASKAITRAKSDFTPVEDAVRAAGFDVDKWKEAGDTLRANGLNEDDLLGGNALERGAFQVLRKVVPDLPIATSARIAKTAHSVLNAGFTLQQFQQAAALSPRFLDALKEGDTDKAWEYGTEALAGTVLGLAGAPHALHTAGELFDPILEPGAKLRPSDEVLKYNRLHGEREALQSVADQQAINLDQQIRAALGHEKPGVNGDSAEVKAQKQLDLATVFHQVVTGGDQTKAAAWHNALVDASNLPVEKVVEAADPSRGVKEVKLPAFKDWFGDSKIVDESGSPLRVYHGTTQDFDSFKSDTDAVHYFSPDPNYASGFAKPEVDWDSKNTKWKENGYTKGGRVVPAYIKLENPYFTQNLPDVEFAGSDKKWVDSLKKQGYDGIVYAKDGNLLKGPTGWGDDAPQYVVFDSKQIRPAIGEIPDNGKTGQFQGNTFVDLVARNYLKDQGITTPQHTGVAQVDPVLAKRVADAYQVAEHNPSDPRVKAAYDALKSETKAQWDAAVKAGIKFEPWTKDGQPYANSKEMAADVRDNKHLYYYPGGDIPADHPLAEVDPETGETYNNIFRAVHDLFGHAKNGYEFGAKGEENAFLAHSKMYSPEAVPALLTETKGQNSWVNFGEHLRTSGPEEADSTHLSARKPQLVPEVASRLRSSKVVGPDNQPTLVHHGTTKNFDTFETPSYFTTDPREAEHYAELSNPKVAAKLRQKLQTVPLPTGYKAGQELSVEDSTFSSPMDAVEANNDGSLEGKVFNMGGDELATFQNGKLRYIDGYRMGDNGEWGPGYKVSIEKGESQSFADEKKHVEDLIEGKYKGGKAGQVKSAYLDIRNPKELSWSEGNMFTRGRWSPETEAKAKALIQEYKSQGYDGIKTISDSAVMMQALGEDIGEIDQWIPFDPHQIIPKERATIPDNGKPKTHLPEKGQPGYVAPPDRPFADQKAFLFPEALVKRALASEPDIRQVSHWSPLSGLTETDPNAKSLTGGAENNRPRVPGNYFGEAAYREPAVQNGKNRYYANIDYNKVYDLETDPHGLRQQAEALARKNATEPGYELEKLIQQNGYEGYRNQNSVKYFEKVPLATSPQEIPVSGKSPYLPENIADQIRDSNFKNRSPEYQKLVLDSLKKVATGDVSEKVKAAAKIARDEQSKNFEIGSANDLLHNQIENYMTRVYKDENQPGKVVAADAKTGRFATDVTMALHRVYDSHITALLKSPKEMDFDAAKNVAQGRTEIIQAAANRGWADNMRDKEIRSSDGRPMLVMSGSGQVITGPEGENPATYIQPGRVRKLQIADARVQQMQQTGELARRLESGEISELTPKVYPDTLDTAISRLTERTQKLKDPAQLAEVQDQLASLQKAKDLSGQQMADALTEYNSKIKPLYAWSPQDYVRINHPAFKGWNFVTNDTAGNGVFVRGDLYAHPEVAQDIINRLGLEESALQKHPITKALLSANTKLKETLLSMSPFHMAQLALRGVMVGVNPLTLNTPDILSGEKINPADPNSPSIIRKLVEHGFTPGTDYKAEQKMSEGVSAGAPGILRKAGPVGRVIANSMDWYQDFLFKRFMPALKANAGEKLFRDYQAKHPDWSIDRVAKVTAAHVNDTFGGINWKAMGRSATTQDWGRLMLLAPDWLESEMRSMGRLFNKGEGDVSRAQVAKMALGVWGIARTLNYMNTGSFHNEAPFGLVTKNKDGKEIVYSMRTLPTDMLHAAADPVNFIKGRLSPNVGIATELMTSRDRYERKLGPEDLWADVFRNMAPIPFQAIGQAVSGTGPQVGDVGQVVKALGGTAQTYQTPAQKMAADLASTHSPEGIVDPALQARHRRVLDMEDAVRRGDMNPQDLARLTYQTDQLSEKEYKQISDNLKKTQGLSADMASLYTRASRLPAAEFLQLWDVSNPSERTALVPLMQQTQKKYLTKAKRDETPAERQRDPVFNRLLNMQIQLPQKPQQ